MHGKSLSLLHAGWNQWILDAQPPPVPVAVFGKRSARIAEAYDNGGDFSAGQ